MNITFDPKASALAIGAKVEPFASKADLRDDPQARKQVRASPFVWRNPSGIPKRKWLYPKTYVRKFVTGTVAPGGAGKSGLAIVEALAMVTGRDLLSDGYQGEPLRVWYWNGEDPLEEIERQLHAAMLHYKIGQQDIADRLYIDSGREMPVKIASSDRTGFKVDAACLSDIKATIRINRIDVALFDPFVSIHSVPENSNEAMDAVVKAFAQVANDCDCAIGVFAHTRKQQAGSAGELSADDARGGKALVDGARVIRVLNRMTKDDGEKAGVIGNAFKRYFWLGSDKINLTPPDTEKSWCYLESVYLPNGETAFEGDNMRVVTAWQWPDAFGDISAADLLRFQTALDAERDRNRQSNQSPQWAGHLLADILGIDTAPTVKGKDNLTPDQKQQRSKCGAILAQWQASGALSVEGVNDEKRDRKYQVYTVGDWAR